jgi:hypothetical protein
MATMGTSKKPSRKNDPKKAQSIHQQYLKHQAKLLQNPESLAAEHWRKEKRNFLNRVNFYYSRAGVKKKNVFR